MSDKKLRDEAVKILDKHFAEKMQYFLGTETAIDAMLDFHKEQSYDFSKSCECDNSIGQTWCCNNCGLPHVAKNIIYLPITESNLLGKLNEAKDIIEWLLLNCTPDRKEYFDHFHNAPYNFLESLKTEQQSETESLKWVLSSERLPQMEKVVAIKDLAGMNRIGNFYKYEGKTILAIHSTNCYDEFLVTEEKMYAYYWLDESSTKSETDLSGKLKEAVEMWDCKKCGAYLSEKPIQCNNGYCQKQKHNIYMETEKGCPFDEQIYPTSLNQNK